MTGEKPKQLSYVILKWQALVVYGQDNDKMNVIVHCRQIFLYLDALARIILKHLTFVCRLRKMQKESKNLKNF